jgi:glycyl-tRNA synthetase alpha subunit
VTLSLNGISPLPTSLHMWQTQFGWNGMEQTQSTFFQRMADVAVVGNTVTVTVPVDAIITLTTVETSESSASRL